MAKTSEADVAEPVVNEAAQSEPLSARVSADDVIESGRARRRKSPRCASRPKRLRGRKGAGFGGRRLKLISGIGPKLANVLKGHGVVTFAQLAGMDEAALAALDAELGLEGRILRDDWAGQARKILATGH